MSINKKEICVDYGKLHRDIYQYFRKNRFSKEDAEENTQETFARYLNANAQVIRFPKAYLFRIARNLIFEITSKKKNSSPYHQGSPSCIPLQDTLLEMRQRQELLKKIFQELSPRSREVFLLHRTQDLTYQEIADRLHISIKTVENHMVKALAHIRKKI